MASGKDLPHDLAQFVAEDALDLPYGFWGCIADGATFKSLRRRRTRPGRQIIIEHRDDLTAAELLVNTEISAWRSGRGTSVGSAPDATLARWQALPPGDGIVLEWAPQAGRRG